MTDKQEHSPLPWRVSPHDGTYLLDANGREVCETGSYTTERDVMKADARLIADAPTLLAENKRLREALVKAEELFAFHEGSAEKHPWRETAHPVIWINEEDFNGALATLRAALQGDTP